MKSFNRGNLLPDGDSCSGSLTETRGVASCFSTLESNFLSNDLSIYCYGSASPPSRTCRTIFYRKEMRLEKNIEILDDVLEEGDAKRQVP